MQPLVKRIERFSENVSGHGRRNAVDQIDEITSDQVVNPLNVNLVRSLRVPERRSLSGPTDPRSGLAVLIKRKAQTIRMLFVNRNT